MKREWKDGPGHDPVLEQLDFLINGPPKEPRAEAPPATPVAPPPPPQPLVPHDPVLLQLDALINGGPPAPATSLAPEEDSVQTGPPGIFREYGGIRGWLRLHCTSPSRSTPPSLAST